MKTILGKSVLALDFISVGQFTTSYHTYRQRRGPSTGGHMSTWHCESSNTITILMRTSKDLREWSYPQCYETILSRNNKETVFSRGPHNAKISVFSGDQKYGINENNFGKKCFGSRFYFSWSIYNKLPHLSAKEGTINRWTHVNMTLWIIKHNYNLNENFKGFAGVALCNISKWGCSQGRMSIDAVPLAPYLVAPQLLRHRQNLKLAAHKPLTA